MPTPSWHIHGQYYETCSCDFVCPCLPGQLTIRPSQGSCTFAMAFQIDAGSFGSVSLDGLGFIVLGLTPEEMGKGNWSVGLIADERASIEQREAITSIASGAAGGPMAALSGLIGKFLGVESAPLALIARERVGRSEQRPWSTWRRRALRELTPTQQNRCTSKTRAIRPLIGSPWRVHPRAT